MEGYLIYGGGFVFLLVLIYEYGWPPIELFDSYLRTDKSRRIASVVCWVLTACFLASALIRVWSTTRDLWKGI